MKLLARGITMSETQKCPHCGEMVEPLVVPADALEIRIGGVKIDVDRDVPLCPSCGLFMLAGKEERQLLKNQSNQDGDKKNV